MHKRISVCLLPTLLLCACSTPTADMPQTPTTSTTETTTVIATTPESVTDVSVDAAWTDIDTTVPTEYADATTILLSDSGVKVDGNGVVPENSIITITEAGMYVVSGTLSDGQLRVEADGVVNLVLNGTSIHGETVVPFFAKDADKVVLTLVDGTNNTFSDSTSCVYEDEANQEPSGTLFSKCDLTINGSGHLTVDAAFQDGIVSRDGLKFADGHITVNAADDAVMGRDYVLVGGGELTLTAAGDGIKSTNDQDETVGFVKIENGHITVTSENDGLQAESTLSIAGGQVNVVSGGGSQNGATHQDDFMRPGYGYGYGSTTTTDTTESAKALKATTKLMISGGTVTLDAADDTLHSNGHILISGGTVEAASGDDGAHADQDLTVTGGSLTISKSYEGIEAARITIDNGTVSVTASDDGFNASSGTTADHRDPMASDGSVLIVNGGTVNIDAQGDGLDSNGTVVITDGTVYVNGPQNGGNGTLDFASSFGITGGTLVAIGSLGMAEIPTSNTMNSITWSGCSLTAGNTLTVTSEDGTVIAQISATRTAQWAYVSTPDLIESETYTISDGNTDETVMLKNGNNTIGNASGGFGGGMGPGDHGGGRPARPGGYMM